MANREACELFIEQEIDEGLKEGKNPHQIGKELSGWIAKLFEIRIKPETLRSRARKQQTQTGKVTGPTKPPVTTQTDNGSEKNQKQQQEIKTHGGSREGAGRPTKHVPITFNQTNENVEWARWTWNPVTGCKHGCPYCYARHIGIRFNGNFEPRFYEKRLTAPKATPFPDTPKKFNPNFTGQGNQSVFVCSMADLFGEWVPEEWIENVLTACRENPQWCYIFLTKNPKRYLEIDYGAWPEKFMIGATVDRQVRVSTTADVLLALREDDPFSGRTFISCEPMLEPIDFQDGIQAVDWLIIGGQSRTASSPEFQPEWEWVEKLLLQARNGGAKVYFKPNLKSRPREYPEF